MCRDTTQGRQTKVIFGTIFAYNRPVICTLTYCSSSVNLQKVNLLKHSYSKNIKHDSVLSIIASSDNHFAIFRETLNSGKYYYKIDWNRQDITAKAISCTITLFYKFLTAVSHLIPQSRSWSV